MVETHPVGRSGRVSGALVVMLVLLAAACSAGRAELPGAGSDRAAHHDLTVRPGRFEDRFLLTGQLVAVNADYLFVPRIPSWQTTVRWLEEEGALVKAGQRLVELDTASFAADYSEKRASLDQSLADLEQSQADRISQRGEKTFDVSKKGIAVDKAKIAAEVPPEFIRGKEYEENQLALQRAKTELNKATEDLEAFETSSTETIRQKEITVEKFRRELEAAGQAMDGMVLKAPRDGVLVIADHPWQGRKIQVGDSVWVGLPVVSLPDLRELRVEAKLADVDDGRISSGLPVVCILDAYPDRKFTGHVGDITPVAQEAAGRSLRRAYNVYVHLDQSDVERMRPGMSVKVEVQLPARENVLLAPRLGIDFSGPRPRARLADGGAADVKLGPCNREACIVLGGVDDGTRLRSVE